MFDTKICGRIFNDHRSVPVKIGLYLNEVIKFSGLNLLFVSKTSTDRIMYTYTTCSNFDAVRILSNHALGLNLPGVELTTHS